MNSDYFILVLLIRLTVTFIVLTIRVPVFDLSVSFEQVEPGKSPEIYFQNYAGTLDIFTENRRK